MNRRRFLACSLLTSALFFSPARASETAPSSSATAADAAYTKTLEDRSDKIVQALDLGDSTKAARVRARIIAQYRSLNAWQATHEARLKELRKSKNPEAAKAEMASIAASRHALRDAFVADLAKDLTPAQLDIVKDKLTYNKLQVTYNGYIQMLPTLTGEQKKKIYGFLVEAREEAFVGVSSGEKDEIFGRYKGRINNYLSKEGYNLNQASKDWKARLDAASAKK